MEQFSIWFKIGFGHIVGIEAQDHILFLVALCACYLVSDWKKLLVLATAFTIGHSITLALITFKIIHINTALVENWLIPLSILLTSLFNLFWNKDERPLMWLKYGVATIFGLIHGAAFSNQLSQLLTNNSKDWFENTTKAAESSIAVPLFAFNVGIEAGQILIIGFILFLSVIFVNILKTKTFTWTTFLSGIAFGVSLSILLERTLQ
jgi:HupE / UreJ protein